MYRKQNYDVGRVLGTAGDLIDRATTITLVWDSKTSLQFAAYLAGGMLLAGVLLILFAKKIG